MKKQHIIFLVISFIVFIVFFYTFTETGKSYLDELKQYREEKNAFMISSGDSPFTAGEQKHFTGLNYFPPNEKFLIKARLERINPQQVILLSETDGTSKSYFKYGYAHFSIDGNQQKLMLLKPKDYKDPNYIFLPFYDATSGKESYGGGRYLEPEVIPPDKVLLDFNKAYNPYCAYQSSYACPIPPKGNYINVPIKAGEKKYQLNK